MGVPVPSPSGMEGTSSCCLAEAGGGGINIWPGSRNSAALGKKNHPVPPKPHQPGMTCIKPTLRASPASKPPSVPPVSPCPDGDEPPAPCNPSLASWALAETAELLKEKSPPRGGVFGPPRCSWGLSQPGRALGPCQGGVGIPRRTHPMEQRCLSRAGSATLAPRHHRR